MTTRGRGPRPKDPDKRARTNTDPIPHTTVRLERAEQPRLPIPPKWLEDLGGWPGHTLKWWGTWGRVASNELFTATDWDFLVDTAIVHAKVWYGDLRYAAELRMRVAKFGATIEDRARLRIFAEGGDPDTADEATKQAAMRPQYGKMRVVPETG